MKIILIAALASNRVIGINNTLPWKLSADLKRFKALTTGHTIVMGRKTFESLGRPLPGRRHICVSRSYASDHLLPDPRWPEQVFWCGDLFSALKHLKREIGTTNDIPIFVIGGAEIYTQALPLADALELTHIQSSFEGDAFFPSYAKMFEKTDESFLDEGAQKFSFAQYKSLRPENIFVRRASKNDVQFIANAQIKMALESEGLKLNPQKVEAGVMAVLNDVLKGEYLVAEDMSSQSHCPVGCLLLQKEWSDWRNGAFLWIHSLYVEPTHRRKGICHWMLTVAQEQARTLGALGMRLYVDKGNRDAQEAYRNFGMGGGHYDVFELEF